MKAHRKRGIKYSKEEVELVNDFKEVGIDYFSAPPAQLFKIVPQVLDGKPAFNFSERAFSFLRANFDVEQVEDVQGHKLLHFKKRGEVEMNLRNEIAERSSKKRETVKAVFEALSEIIKETLEKDRRIRIPGFVTIKVSYRPAKPKRKGTNPFTGKPMMFKAKEASNKLRISASKELKTFASELRVVEPKKKKGKKSKKSSKKSSKD